MRMQPIHLYPTILLKYPRHPHPFPSHPPHLHHARPTPPSAPSAPSPPQQHAHPKNLLLLLPLTSNNPLHRNIPSLRHHLPHALSTPTKRPPWNGSIPPRRLPRLNTAPDVLVAREAEMAQPLGGEEGWTVVVCESVGQAERGPWKCERGPSYVIWYVPIRPPAMPRHIVRYAMIRFICC
jgi:hypothetical protein